MDSKLIARAVSGTAAFMSHHGPHANGATGNEFDDYMSNFFEHKVHGVARLLNAASPEGKEAIESLRTSLDNPDFTPNFMPPDEALRILLKTNRAQSVIPHGGLGKTATMKLDWLVQQELRERFDIRLDEQLDGVNKKDKTRDEDDVEVEAPPAQRVKTEARSPQADGVIYCTRDEYIAGGKDGKRKLTSAINKARKELGLGSWVRKFYEDGSPDIGDGKGPRKGKRKSELEKDTAVEGGEQQQNDEREAKKQKLGDPADTTVKQEGKPDDMGLDGTKAGEKKLVKGDGEKSEEKVAEENFGDTAMSDG